MTQHTEIPYSEEFNPEDYGMKLLRMYSQEKPASPIYSDVREAYEEAVKPRISFRPPPVSDQPLASLLEDIDMLKHVGLGLEEAPSLDEIISAIEGDLEKAVSEEEYYRKAQAYENWLQFVYGFQANLTGQ